MTTLWSLYHKAGLTNRPALHLLGCFFTGKGPSLLLGHVPAVEKAAALKKVDENEAGHHPVHTSEYPAVDIKADDQEEEIEQNFYSQGGEQANEPQFGPPGQVDAGKQGEDEIEEGSTELDHIVYGRNFERVYKPRYGIDRFILRQECPGGFTSQNGIAE